MCSAGLQVGDSWERQLAVCYVFTAVKDSLQSVLFVYSLQPVYSLDGQLAACLQPRWTAWSVYS